MPQIHILHIEDDPLDAELIKARLDEDGLACGIEVVETEEAFVDSLNNRPPDLILADYALPAFDGLRALSISQKSHPLIPFILVSGAMGEEIAIESLKYGATDYVLKTNLKRLAPAVLRALHEKKERARRLQAEEKIVRLSAAIEHSSDAVIITDPDGTIQYVNPAFEKTSGYLQSEVIGGSSNLLKSGSHDERFYRDMWETIRAGKTWHKTLVNRKKDGSLFYDDTSISPIYSQAGDIEGFVAIKRDITRNIEERRKKQREKDFQRRLADIFLTFPDNQIYEKVLQLLLENLESKHGLFGYIDENRNLIIPSLVGAIFEGCGMEAAEGDVVLSHKSWAGIWSRALEERSTVLLNDSTRVPEGHLPVANLLLVPIVYKEEVIGLLATGNKKTDYTEEDRRFLQGTATYIAPILYARLQRDFLEQKRREAEKQIQDYSENLKSMVEERTRELNTALHEAETARERVDGILKSVASGLIVVDNNNRINLMNRRAEILLGIQPAEALDRSVELIFKDDQQDWKDISKGVDTEKTYSFEFDRPAGDSKEQRRIQARISGLYDKEENRTGFVLIIYDITREHEIDRLKTEFISTAAHEFRTPVTSILGFSEILLIKDDLSQEEKKKFLTFINKQAVSLSMIVSDLLDISRIEAKTGFLLDRTLCHAGETINDILSFFRTTSPGHEFKFISSVESDMIYADREKIGQVLKNILSNAVKYSPRGGEITVKGRLTGPYYLISITDRGIGMTPDQTEKIFDKFYRADSSDTAIEGTGLGLTIVKYIVEEHGGRIFVDSEFGQGTTVYFTVPTTIPEQENRDENNSHC